MWSAIVATLFWLFQGAPVAHEKPYRPRACAARPSQRVTELPDLAWDPQRGVVDARTGETIAPEECEP